MDIYTEKGKDIVFNTTCYKCDKTCNHQIMYTMEDVKRYWDDETMNDNDYCWVYYIECPYSSGKRIYVEDPKFEIQRKITSTETTISNHCIYG